MNAVNFRISELKKLVDEHIYIAVRNLCIMSTFVHHESIFGHKACAEFWKKINKEACYFALVEKA